MGNPWRSRGTRSTILVVTQRNCVAARLIHPNDRNPSYRGSVPLVRGRLPRASRGSPLCMLLSTRSTMLSFKFLWFCTEIPLPNFEALFYHMKGGFLPTRLVASFDGTHLEFVWAAYGRKGLDLGPRGEFLPPFPSPLPLRLRSLGVSLRPRGVCDRARPFSTVALRASYSALSATAS